MQKGGMSLFHDIVYHSAAEPQLSASSNAAAGSLRFSHYIVNQICESLPKLDVRHGSRVEYVSA
jgi:hypothetical protein